MSSIFFSLCAGHMFMTKEKSVFQEACCFLIARGNLCFLCSKPSPKFSLKSMFGLIFPRGNPFLSHLPCCYLTPFPIKKEHLISTCSSCFVHISCELLLFYCFLFEVNFFSQLLHLF